MPLITDEAMELLCTRDWPGNVRELEHSLYRTIIFTQGYPIHVGYLSRAVDNPRTARLPPEGFRVDQLTDLVRRYLSHRSGPGTCEWMLHQIERLLIAESLRRTDGNQSQASQFLGLSRATLHAKIQRHGLASQRPEPTDRI